MSSYSSPHRHSSANISNEIRLEIQRFESVHPSIYAIYDLIEGITDHHLQNQIRDHVVNIEDSFVNSQEWTTSRGVPDLKLGITGFVNSGKSALVHRYLTGSYMQEESPEGGRFKKEIVVDGQSYLLLIRDEGGTPESQFTNWVDVVIFVFSLENEMSFSAVPSYYSKMCHYRDMSQVPIILVGTQDNISEDNPRKIDDSRAKQLELELGARCKYFETCATYGLNVEHVFQEACQRATHERVKSAYSIISRVSGTSLHRNHASNSGYANPRILQQSAQHNNNPPESPQPQHTIPSQSFQTPTTVMREHSGGSIHRSERQQRSSSSSNYSSNTQLWQQPVPPNHLPINNKTIANQQFSPSHEYLMNMNNVRDELENLTSPEGLSSPSSHNAELTPLVKRRIKKLTSSSIRKSNSFHGILTDRKQHTPNSTPVMSRKNKKNSSQSAVSGITTSQEGLTNMINSYGGGDTSDNPTPLSTPTQTRKHNRRRSNLFNNNQPRKEEVRYDELGVGREIPVKQGYLYKKGSKGLTKDWKKKYVTLTQSGKLIYHPNINDYMIDSHGKEITLLQTTVKIPGQHRPRLKTQLSNGANTTTNDPTLQLQAKTSHSMPRDIMGLSSGGMTPVAGIQAAKMESTTPHIKRRHRRAKSGSKIDTTADGNDSDGYEFTIVSLDNKQWHFEATTQEDRDVWVNSIEKQIFNSLTGNPNVRKSKHDPNAVTAIKSMPGNNVCADCGTENPSWASLNLGSLICIECSGIHRNLGTHHSRVRSLELDEWPPDVTAVMLAIGNQRSNSIWEARAPSSKKPTPTASRDVKEQWIRSKYEHKEYLAERPHKSAPISHLLIDAIARQELSQVIVCLADSNPEEVSAPYSASDRRTPLHIAAQQDNPIFLQLLLWYGADVKKLDQEGRSALWYAKQVGSKECSSILQANGSSESQATLQRMRKSSLKPSAFSNNNETSRRDRISVNSVN